MLIRLLPSFADDWKIQTATDHGGDLPEWYSVLCHRVIVDFLSILFESEPIDYRSVESMHCWPVIEPVAHEGRNALFSSEANEYRNKAMITLSVH